MTRREAVEYISILLGGTIVGANAFITGCKSETGKEHAFTEDDIAYLDEIAETILPATKTPGAKAAKVGMFMTVMVNDCYEEDQQKVFKEGMKKINELSNKEYSKDFMEIDPAQRHALLVKLDAEQKEYNKKKKPTDPPHYFRLMKELTLNGYFTSEIGCTQARRYIETPGKFEGCVPYQKGDKAWA
ncbi:gluconate 2-dehydrogenase subunit 3 family protein [Chitinophagaceae bacterium LB-8]|uniref:Gluconate 2-dehydrogenase subunit 3 family protein n=1 Tax=Paraflavisolibacter caeni TaxID=2982496 RepID=A0A9X3BFJ7_9BACT|nr:gluconate 2-dehydrogenase subunit 3 family protein [Paraflavisolibacter caeni]MCU7549024.1 gluconate 2-dehydrogenase subunit 3 family protein [Paraflavisolibacter caeni]